MKWSLLVMMVISWSLGAMNTFNEQSSDEVIEMGEIKKESKNKRPKSHRRNNSFDIELQEREPRGDYYTHTTFDKEKYIQNFLLELPIFKGKKEAKVSSRMDQIEHILPKEFGEITESLSIFYDKFKKRVKRGVIDIDPNEVVIINDKIKYALLEIAHENQQIAAKNREEDLAQAAGDRRCSIITTIVGFGFSIPAIALSIFNIIKLYNQ